MSSYDVIAQFYDTVVVDPTKKAQWLKQLIQEHRPTAESVLELACGTGSILEVLTKDYRVAGLDNSEGMLQIARKKLPDTEFFQADMANFSIGQKFDVVLCIYDSINHLIRFSEWQSMFQRVTEHLKPGGLYIFDMNTVEFLNKLNTSEPSVSHFSDNTMTIGGEPGQEAITVLKVTVSEKRPDGSTQIYKTDLPETSFSIPEVQTALEGSFKVLRKLGEQKITNWTKDDNKVVFVCQLREKGQHD